MKISEQITLIDVNPDNVASTGIFCIKNKKAPGYAAKLAWFRSRINQGLKIKIAIDSNNKQLGFIEYIPSESAWRPVKAENYLFIQCIAVMVKEERSQGIGSLLLQQCETDAKKVGKSGICSMSSDGAWMANKKIFESNGFIVSGKQDRFELMVKAFDKKVELPQLMEWTRELAKYKGWHIVYADQCPWHEKSVTDILHSAHDHGIDLTVRKISSPREAQKAPSGFGTFSLIRDGRLLADHYISRTRFVNILKQEGKK